MSVFASASMKADVSWVPAQAASVRAPGLDKNNFYSKLCGTGSYERQWNEAQASAFLSALLGAFLSLNSELS